MVVYATTKLGVEGIHRVKKIKKYLGMSRIEKLLEFLRATPNDSFLQHALALEYVKTGDDAAARNLFEAILKREPGYTGSYYHLGKLLERNGDAAGAIEVYKTGMAETRKADDRHAYNELRAALEELEDY
jgi:tetratricopeptide (TPR) repeat protein